MACQVLCLSLPYRQRWLPYPHSLRRLASNKGDRTECKSRKPLHSPPSASIIPMLHALARLLLPPLRKRLTGKSPSRVA